ncbi:unnamed protein product [Menidia menidia]|uniref:(Atlantic silverside) hypothetical protein n=1 Tax=Menidia menidia TaxID=238744 RepID=A0A8S4BFZ9_9TELE|nr:unnamed protein product [Menidia menidia]
MHPETSRFPECILSPLRILSHPLPLSPQVYLKAPMILNGHEDALAQAAFEEARRRTRDFEDRDRSHREDLEVRGRRLSPLQPHPCRPGPRGHLSLANL